MNGCLLRYSQIPTWTLVCAACLVPCLAAAGDWPQVLGPNRNGIAAQDERIAVWPGPKPPTVWQRKVGRGYAGPAIAQGRLVLFHRVDDAEVVECLDAATGEPLWKQEYPTDFNPGVGSGDGPLCTPTISGDSVITYGPQGVLSCWKLTTGKPLWSRQTHKDYRANEGYFGAGSSPLVEGELVIANVGGRQNAGLVAFDRQTGKTLWTQTNEEASYAAPTVATIDEQRCLIAVTRLKCVGLDPATGRLWFEFPFGSRGPTVNGATPLIFQKQHLFVTASYGVGAVCGRVSILGFEKDWDDGDTMASQYATCVEHDGDFFGIHGRDDVPPADLKCFDPIENKVHWVKQNFGYGVPLLADGKLLILKTDGELVMVSPSRSDYVEEGRASLFRSTTRALPALSNGLFYARDEEILLCVDLRVPPRKRPR